MADEGGGGLGLFPTILAIGVGVGVGFAAPYLAPGLFAAGTSFSLGAAALGFSIASVVGQFVFSETIAPDMSSAVGAQLANIRDPEWPRLVAYGETLIGFSYAWDEVRGDDLDEYLFTGILCDHKLRNGSLFSSCLRLKYLSGNRVNLFFRRARPQISNQLFPQRREL